ncbi:hypothetical protein TNIN_263561 [Trichonephila inaurata madagascariensis]|uniref:Uncharacterized protein n=1 Tax=Trichonephila inaurata madagascariensis TaxID=2747483 RepID=A0A8X6IHB7_9ARAC|nr:hypothetical protein TNIN_263561 [Trichonephila inaurata madagascariensis]
MSRTSSTRQASVWVKAPRSTSSSVESEHLKKKESREGGDIKQPLIISQPESRAGFVPLHLSSASSGRSPDRVYTFLCSVKGGVSECPTHARPVRSNLVCRLKKHQSASSSVGKRTSEEQKGRDAKLASDHLTQPETGATLIYATSAINFNGRSLTGFTPLSLFRQKELSVCLNSPRTSHDCVEALVCRLKHQSASSSVGSGASEEQQKGVKHYRIECVSECPTHILDPVRSLSVQVKAPSTRLRSVGKRHPEEQKGGKKRYFSTCISFPTEDEVQ